MPVVALCLMMLAACGNPPGLPGVVAPIPPTQAPTSPGAGFDVVLTENDRAVVVHAGQKLEVFLRARAGMQDWSQVQSNDDAVLVAVPTGITAGRGVTVAGFKAASAGRATISASAGPVCASAQPCPMYEAVVSIEVTVTP